MSSVNKYRPLPSDYQELIAALKQHIAQGERDVVDFEHRHYNGVREKAVIYCLRHALDLAKGCLAIALAELPDSLTTLSRAIFDALFWAKYVTLSIENAQEFIDSPINEMKRISRKNLTAGYAHVFDTKTNEDKSIEFQNSSMMKEIPRWVRIEDAARAGGLERVYTTLYGFDSMIAHGRAFDLLAESDIKDVLYASISAFLGALQCIEVITSDWIIHRKETPKETLTHMLGI